MKTIKKASLVLLLVLNILVLLGQLWPAAAPPFARTVNIIFLIACLVYFSLAVKK